mgnify:CR=1 FL=1
MDFITPILGIIGEVFKKVWPDPAQQAEAQFKLTALQHSGALAELNASLQTALAQIEVNKEETKSDSIFKSGWRPAIGWVCGFAFAWQFVGYPFLRFIFTLAGHSIDIPQVNLSEMMPVLLGMLGLGGMRTFEKIQGKA